MEDTRSATVARLGLAQGLTKVSFNHETWNKPTSLRSASPPTRTFTAHNGPKLVQPLSRMEVTIQSSWW
jgi:hypothetical protein